MGSLGAWSAAKRKNVEGLNQKGSSTDRRNGSRIRCLPHSKGLRPVLIFATDLRYLGYLVADLTDSLKLQMEMNYYASVDADGYFRTLPSGEGYVEIISYDKLMRDAKRRNRVLFEKLGLHKH